MSAINDDVYARVRDKVKEHELTEQEIKAIDRARDQLQSHSKTNENKNHSCFFFINIVL